MRIKQFRYSSDNLGYLVCLESVAVAIDGGAVNGILNFLKINDIDLKFITNTHGHADHTVGNKSLLQNSKAELIDPRNIEKGSLNLNGKDIQVFPTPGHTLDSVIFKIGNNLITGDTLFIGKVGRCFSGSGALVLSLFLQVIKLV